MQITAAEINNKNEHFWSEMQKAFNDTIATKPAIFEEVLREAQADSLRYPVRFRRPLEQVMEDVKARRKSYHAEFSTKGGKSKKTNELNALITPFVRRNPNISRSELLVVLQSRQPIPPISEINIEEQEIVLSDGKIFSLRGLADRLSRIKKKLKSH